MDWTGADVAVGINLALAGRAVASGGFQASAGAAHGGVQLGAQRLRDPVGEVRMAMRGVERLRVAEGFPAAFINEVFVHIFPASTAAVTQDLWPLSFQGPS